MSAGELLGEDRFCWINADTVAGRSTRFRRLRRAAL